MGDSSMILNKIKYPKDKSKKKKKKTDRKIELWCFLPKLNLENTVP